MPCAIATRMVQELGKDYGSNRNHHDEKEQFVSAIEEIYFLFMSFEISEI